MWLYKGAVFELPEEHDFVGFVYIITCLPTGKQYVGKKWFSSSTRKPPLKGKKRKRLTVKASNWLDYWGSNKILQEDVKTLGKEHFTREILHLCKSKGMCSYLETKEQFDRDVLLSDKFYNTFIGCRINKSHLRINKLDDPVLNIPRKI